jgi:group I intron endonuclease
MARQASGFIYKITSPTNRVYIGQSININSRMRKYKNLKCEKQFKIYNSLKKYGFENHSFDIIKKCDIKDLNENERYYQELYDCVENGLNCVYVETKVKKKIVSQETKNKQSIIKKGKKISEETKEKMRISHFKRDKTISKETREKLINSKKNISKKTREKLSILNRKIVIDLNTGVFYDSCNEVSNLYKIKRTTLSAKLSGQNKNNTQFKYI